MPQRTRIVIGAPYGRPLLVPDQRRARRRARRPARDCRQGGKRKTTTVAVAWAPADTADITPGVQMYTDGAQCTANFVFTDGAGNIYVGYAAHCAGTGGATDTNGCDAGFAPARHPRHLRPRRLARDRGQEVGQGTLAYCSWLTMQQRNETDENACDYNDLALVKVDAADVANGQPERPVLGRPGRRSTPTAPPPASRVYSYGNSSLRGGVEELSPEAGHQPRHRQRAAGTTRSTRVTPGVPGDSGSAFLDAQGNALGTLSTLSHRAARRLQRRGRPAPRARLRAAASAVSPA